MDKKRYQEMVKDMTPKENRLLNMFISFTTGGLIGVIGTFIYKMFLKNYNEELSISFLLLVLIIITAFLTCAGIGDKIFQKLKCGIIIPITGFAHSVSSSILDYKKEGFIPMGSNTFKLAGCVILYGIVSSIILTLIRVVLNV
ncbi:MAG: SpoVA/SpoVAEb family sporulation membrane protein [Bacilli bacterium]|nr:SpoVA/SpoVAEb family sporulation membrane protein [Bacilli bacterium]